MSALESWSFLNCMDLHVFLQVAFLGKTFRAWRASEWFRSCVSSVVIHKVPLFVEPFATFSSIFTFLIPANELFANSMNNVTYHLDWFDWMNKILRSLSLSSKVIVCLSIFSPFSEFIRTSAGSRTKVNKDLQLYHQVDHESDWSSIPLPLSHSLFKLLPDYDKLVDWAFMGHFQ